MYTLYFKKDKQILKVSKAVKSLHNYNFTEEVTQFNDCYYFCIHRKPLVEKAREMQKEWIAELATKLDTLKNLKIGKGARN